MMVMRTLAPWMPAGTPLLCQNIVRRALCDVAICEIPEGSNRSGRIDEYNTATGAPLGSYWCASALTAWWKEAGAEVPKSAAASCDTWLRWAKKTKRFTSTPKEGYAVLYGTGENATHCGVVIRTSPILLAIEGNTSVDGGFNRNGVAVDLKRVSTPRVIGYVSPTPIS